MRNRLFALCLSLSFSTIAQIPTLDWVQVQGSTNAIVPTSTTSDIAGNVYVAGIFRGVNTFGGGNTNTNIQQMFIEKLDANGTLLWSQIFNGNSANNDYISGIQVDGSGNIYTTGYFQGTVDFNPSSATANLVSAGSTDIFIQKFNSSGNLLWAKRIGGTGQDKAHALGIDANKNIYIAGSYAATVDFNPDAGTNASTALNSSLDAFVVKLDSNGTYLWHDDRYDMNDSEFTTIAVTANGDNYAAGYSYESHSLNKSQVVAQKRNATGTRSWSYNSSSIYTNSYGRTQSIAVDVDGNAYLTGIYNGYMNFGNGYVSSADGKYVMKLNTAGAYTWFKVPNMEPAKIALNAQHQVFVFGTLANTVCSHADAPVGFFLRGAGNRDPIMVQFDSSGAFVWASLIGGANVDAGTAMNIDPNNKIILAGTFSGTADFDPSAAADSSTGSSTANLYILKLDQCTYGQRIDSVSTCANSYVWTNGNGQTYSGGPRNVMHVLPGAASNGCDSVLYLRLSFLYQSFSNVSDTACGSYTWAANGQTYQTSGYYSHTLSVTNYQGCDSVLMLNLHIKPQSTSTDVRQGCGSLVWIDGNTYTQSNSNAATYTLVAANGCDSVITLNFQNSGYYPNNIFIDQGELVTEDEADTYQWIDCDNNNAPIPGATQWNFRPTRSGNYALITTNSICTSTSNCLNYTLTGIEEHSHRPLIYPNPSKGELNIELQGLSAVRITNVQGQVLYQAQDLNGSLHRLNFKPVSGLYFVEVQSQGQSSVHKLIIE